LIILGTTSPDCITPASSVVLQHKLGAKNAGALDVDCACAAFPVLVAIGAGLITTNPAMKTVLLVGVDIIYRLTDKNNAGSFFWSDGTGAAVLEGGNSAGFIGAAFQSDGAYAARWGIIAGGTFEPANVDAVKDHRTMMRREAGNYPASVNEDNWPGLFRRLSSECGFTADEVDQLIFTQISKPSFAIAAQPIEKCHTIMEKYGYTGTACIPMALDDGIELGKIKRGDLAVMISSGLGWNQVAAAVRMTM
jgi:3-oxoacyl-[acyl-carrier-protein] synthase-3